MSNYIDVESSFSKQEIIRYGNSTNFSIADN